MEVNPEQAQRAKLRISAALQTLNEALDDANRLGLRNRIQVIGGPENQRAQVAILKMETASATK